MGKTDEITIGCKSGKHETCSLSSKTCGCTCHTPNNKSKAVTIIESWIESVEEMVDAPIITVHPRILSSAMRKAITEIEKSNTERKFKIVAKVTKTLVWGQPVVYEEKELAILTLGEYIMIPHIGRIKIEEVFEE